MHVPQIPTVDTVRRNKKLVSSFISHSIYPRFPKIYPHAEQLTQSETDPDGTNNDASVF